MSLKDKIKESINDQGYDFVDMDDNNKNRWFVRLKLKEDDAGRIFSIVFENPEAGEKNLEEFPEETMHAINSHISNVMDKLGVS